MSDMLFFNNDGWKPAEIEITTSFGPRKIVASVKGGLALHGIVYQHSLSETAFVVTHVQSGRQILPSCERETAQWAANYALQVTDWTTIAADSDGHAMNLTDAIRREMRLLQRYVKLCDDNGETP